MGCAALHLELRGEVFSGIGKGRYYVGHPEYQRRFEAVLGYRPYPGTLNVRLVDEGSREKVRNLRAGDGMRIESFNIGGEDFSSLNCFKGSMLGVEVTYLMIDVTHYNESVVELISPVYLRGKLGLKDGDVVKFALSSRR